jgi:hypothetical protein
MTKPTMTPERAQRLLENSTGEHWYFQPGWGLQYWKDGGLGLLIADGQEGAVTGHDFALIEASQDLATAYIQQAKAQAEPDWIKLIADAQGIVDNADRVLPKGYATFRDLPIEEYDARGEVIGVGREYVAALLAASTLSTLRRQFEEAIPRAALDADQAGQ